MKFLSTSLHLWPVWWHSSWQECFWTRTCSSTCNLWYVLSHKHTQSLWSVKAKYELLAKKWLDPSKGHRDVECPLGSNKGPKIIFFFNDKLPPKLLQDLLPCYGWYVLFNSMYLVSSLFSMSQIIYTISYLASTFIRILQTLSKYGYDCRQDSIP